MNTAKATPIAANVARCGAGICDANADVSGNGEFEGILVTVTSA